MKIGHKLLDRYLIEVLVGEGATATVFRAQDLRLGRVVAIKVLSPYVREAARKRFIREARSAAALNHPGIMAIYDQDTEDEQDFLVVEYIEGRLLTDFIPSPPELVADVGVQLCRALDYAHQRNIIHRDIKPANICVTPEGTAKIMDFGLAMERDAKHITAVGSVIGTPAYLSPEQARGSELDHRTDIYSLGVVLYELLTGVLPFDSHDISLILLQKVTKRPPPPRTLKPETPHWLNAALIKALEVEAENRFQTAGEFAVALSGGDSVQATRDVLRVSPEARPATMKPTQDAEAVATDEDAITVIVADDHTILRASIAMYLDDQPGIRVIGEAGTGEEVLRLCHENPPGVLLLDLNMPGQSGLEVLPQIRRAHPETQVLILTGRTEDAFIMRALQAGAHGYMLKTSEQEELLDAVRRVAKGNLVLGTGVAEKVVAGLLGPHEDPLSDEERTVLICIAAGCEENDEIAAQTGYSAQEVAEHLIRVIDKLGVVTRSEAALKALRAGWISLDEAHHLAERLDMAKGGG